MVGQAAAMIFVLLLSSAPAGFTQTIELPRPQSEQLNGFELFEMLGVSRDRLPASTVPGPISNDEQVDVAVAGDGSVRQVRDQQRIGLTGQGDYHIREAGPARSATALGDEQPVLDFGDIVWQGFSPGRRQLAADLTLDPQIEGAHLPLRLTLSFAAGSRPGGAVPSPRLPGPGTVRLTVTNTTRQPTVVPTARDAAAQPVAAALDGALRAAHASAPGRLPTIRTILPATVPVTGATTRRATEVAPLRLAGELRLSGGATASAAPPARPESVHLDALLEDTVTFTLPTDGQGTLTLDLTAVPVLDVRSLTPPRGFASWAAWSAAGPSAAERRSALDLLVQTAADGARASAYSPYLGPHLGPAGTTVFHYTLAPQAVPVVPAPALKPRPVPIVLSVVAALLLVTGSVVVWRRS